LSPQDSDSGLELLATIAIIGRGMLILNHSLGFKVELQSFLALTCNAPVEIGSGVMEGPGPVAIRFDPVDSWPSINHPLGACHSYTLIPVP